MLSPAAGQRGVTLIEMLIGIAVLALLFGIALPSFREWMQNNQIRNAADALVNGLQVARGHAVARNVAVQFQLQGGNTWRVTEVATGTAVQNWSAQEGAQNSVITASPGMADTVTFGAMGRVVPNADGSASLTALDVTAASAITGATRPMRVTIGQAGSTRLCDPGLGNASDPRSC